MKLHDKRGNFGVYSAANCIHDACTNFSCLIPEPSTVFAVHVWTHVDIAITLLWESV